MAPLGIRDQVQASTGISVEAGANWINGGYMATQWTNAANSALTDEWQKLFRGRKTGDVVDFAGGKMTINVNGDPTMEGSYSGNWVAPDGQSFNLNRVGQGRDARANAHPAIADYYNKQYGFLSNTARLNSNLAAGTATDLAGNILNNPQVAGIYNPLTGQTSGTGSGYVDPIFKINPNSGATPSFGGNTGGLPPGLSGATGGPSSIGRPGGPSAGGSFGAPSGGGLVQDVNVNQYQQNPYLSQMGDVLTNRVTDNLNRNILPGIRSNAVMAGGFGGSRQGVVEANAMKDANQGISDALTGAYFQDFTNQMNRNLQQYGQNQNFYSNQRGQDLQQTALGANLFQQGNSGFLSQGSGIYGLGTQQQQAPWQVVNNGNAGLGQWRGYGTTTSANQGGGAQGALGGALAGGQYGKLWGNSGSSQLGQMSNQAIENSWYLG